jgi:hypothetical protein
MLTLLILAPVFFVVLVITTLVRILVGPFRYHPRYHRHFYGNNPYTGWAGGCRPHRFGGLGLILFLAAIDRFFDRHF